MASFQWLDDEETLAIPGWDVWLEKQSEAKRATVLATLEKQAHYLEIDPSARKTAVDHVSAFHVEQAGLLIGYAFERTEAKGNASSNADIKRYIIQVTDAIPAKDDEATPVSVQIPPNTWGLAQPYLEAGKLVVGWYHSHPNLGAFFSSTDRRAQAALFNHGYSVGWVIDWVRGEEAVFIGASAVNLKTKHDKGVGVKTWKLFP